MNRIYNAEYYESEHHAFVKGNGVSYSERERMYPFFEQIAEKIIKNYAPKTVLDVGCAYGYLVEALRCRGVEAYGIDISEYAISCVTSEIRPYVFLNSASEELPKNMPHHYDVIVSIEVLEHMTTEEGEKALNYLCSLTDTFLFSSTDNDIQDITHINVQRKEYWARIFAKNGFFRNVQQRPLYISSQADVYQKRTDIENLIQEYEIALRIESTKEKLEELPCQVYYNIGNGLSEDQKIIISKGILGEKIEFEVEVPDNTIELRFDPTESRYSVISNLEIWMNGEKKEIEVLNGQAYGSQWIFLTLDPQIQIRTTQGGILKVRGNIYFLNDCKISPSILVGSLEENKGYDKFVSWMEHKLVEQIQQSNESVRSILYQQEKENLEYQKNFYEQQNRILLEKINQLHEEEKKLYLEEIIQLQKEQKELNEMIQQGWKRFNRTMQRIHWKKEREK